MVGRVGKEERETGEEEPRPEKTFFSSTSRERTSDRTEPVLRGDSGSGTSDWGRAAKLTGGLEGKLELGEGVGVGRGEKRDGFEKELSEFFAKPKI